MNKSYKDLYEHQKNWQKQHSSLSYWEYDTVQSRCVQLQEKI